MNASRSGRPMHDLWFDPYGFPPCSDTWKSLFFSSCLPERPFNPLDGLFISLPTSLYLAINVATSTALYQLLCFKSPSSRAKQIIAVPLLVWLLAMPVFFTASNRLIHLICAVMSISSAMRFVDVYYLKPWTGMMSFYNGQLAAYHSKRQKQQQSINGGTMVEKKDNTQGSTIAIGKQETCTTPLSDSGDRLRSRVVKSLSNNNDNASGPLLSYDSDQRIEARQRDEEEGLSLDEWLMWDKERMHAEMWAPLRRLPNVGNGHKRDENAEKDEGVHWTTLLPTFLIYAGASDVLLYAISEVRVAVVERMTTWQYFLFICAAGGVITLNLLWFFYIVMFVWAITTGERIRASEWTMITHRLPLFTTDPADFWSQWHTLFRYIWVDLAFFPIRRFVQLYLGPQRTGSKATSKALEMALPVLGVFFLSSVLHSYIVWSTWRLSPKSQFLYFAIQGLAVVATRGFQKHTGLGQRCCRYYASQPVQTRKWLDRVGMVAMIGYHALTASIFIEPYVKHGLWLDVRPRSVLWLLLGKP